MNKDREYFIIWILFFSFIVGITEVSFKIGSYVFMIFMTLAIIKTLEQ